jgi:HAMP domain-containing protein
MVAPIRTRSRFFSSLPVRLAAALLLLNGLVLVTLTVLRMRAVERILADQAEIEAAIATTAVTQGLEGVIGPTEQMVKLSARTLADTEPTKERLSASARDMLSAMPNVFGVSIAFEEAAGNRVGLAVERSNSPGGFQLRDLAAESRPFWQQDWYREARDKGIVVWSEPYFDRGGSEHNVVRVSAPIFRHPEDATPAGVISAVIALDWLRHLANLNEFSASSHVIVFSRSGRLSLHPRASFVIAETMATLAEKAGAPELATVQAKVASRRQGFVVYADALSHRRIHLNYQPAKLAGWGVAVGYDEAEFLRPQLRFRRIAFAFLGLTLLLVGGAVVFVTRRSLQRLAPLAAAADEISRGNLEVDVPAPPRADEIGVLTASFRAMRDGLKAQRLQNRWAAQALEHQLKYSQLVIDSMGELVFVLTKALNISRINPAVTKELGLVATDVLKAPLGRVVQTAPGAPAAIDTIAQAVAAGAVTERLPVRVVAKDGRLLPGQLSFAPLVDSNQVVGGVATIRIEIPAAGA